MNAIVKNVVLILIGAFAGIWFSAHHTSPKAIPESKPGSGYLASIEVQASRIAQEMYASEINSLKKQNDQLNSQVSAGKAALQQERADNRLLGELVDTLVAHVATESDTAKKLHDCDSLATTVQQIMNHGLQKDSLCDDVITSLEHQVANKDSTIDMQHRAYSTLRLSFENCLIHEDLAENQFKTLERHNRGLVIKNKVLAGGVLLLSGVITYGIIRR